jgi:hypothetical protein
MRVDERRLAGCIDLPAQPVHVHFDRVRHRVVILVPDMFRQLGTSHDPLGIARQILEHRVLLRREPDLALAARRRAPPRVHHEVADAELRGQQLGQPSEQCAQSRVQLLERERLGEIVVRAGIEAGNAVRHPVPRGQHENGHAHAAPAEIAAHRETVPLRQSHVEHQRVVLVHRGEVERAVSLCADVHGIALLAQPALEQLGQPRVVFGHQQSHPSPRIAVMLR